MTDLSALDSKYFVDRFTYNCPYCKRRNVSYRITSRFRFDWTDNKMCYGYFVKCSSCDNTSMHLSFTDLETETRGNFYYFQTDDVDELFFFQVPRTFFVLDERIPRVLRELLDEADGCLKANFLTGASVCVRKVIYELAAYHKATGDHYEDRIKSLKSILTTVDSTYFDAMLTIQQVTSNKVHEESYDGWNASHLRVLLAALHDIMNEVYVIPAEREKRRGALLQLKSEVLGEGKPPAE